MPIKRPMIIDKKIIRHDTRYSEILIKVGLYTSTMMCADHYSTPAIPRNMTNCTNSKMRINSAFFKSYSGRLLRHNVVVSLARLSITWIKINSPTMRLKFEEIH